jgi:ElaB/YqjD/DUF883 family membrane-anchored ribosome-binding protein
MQDNKYLNDLKEELNHYKKKLSTIDPSLKDTASKQGDKMYEIPQRALKEGSDAYEKLKSASEEEWAPLKEIAQQSFEDLKASFKDLEDSTSEQVKNFENQIEEYSQETFEASIDYIKANPLKSILLAGGLGFVMGRLLK